MPGRATLSRNCRRHIHIRLENAYHLNSGFMGFHPLHLDCQSPASYSHDPYTQEPTHLLEYVPNALKIQ